MTLVRQVLNTKGRNVHVITPNALVFDALRMMADNNVGSLVVMEGEKLVGIITESDIFRMVAQEWQS